MRGTHPRAPREFEGKPRRGAALNLWVPLPGEGAGGGASHGWKHTCVALALAFLSISPLYAAPLRVVATTSDLASITRHVGGDLVTVTSLSGGQTDPHHVEPRPSMVQQLRQADAVVVVGMDLDGWSDGLIRVSQNPRLQSNANGYIDASAKIVPLDVPTGKLDGRQGDIHVHGNPHYWLDPLNGILIAETIAAKLSKLSPENEAVFRANAANFGGKIRAQMPKWTASLSGLKGEKLVAYHPTWIYFTTRFGLTVTGHIQPFPGVSPSVSSMMALSQKMKKEKVAVIIVETYSPQKEAERLAQETGAKVAVLAPSVGAVSTVSDYLDLISYNVATLARLIR
jgi:zinc/manganese transport system substrate-binding protein